MLENHAYTAVSNGLRFNPYSQWQFKVSGAYRFPRQISLGAFLRYQQGYPYVLVSFGGCGGFFCFVEPWENRRHDNLFTLDLKVDKEITLSDYGRLNLMVEIFNATNSNTVIRRVQFLEDPEVNRILEFLSPRVMRLGLRYSF